MAWNGNNIGGSLKRGVGIAMHVGFGNLGGVIAAFVYQTKYAPRYVTSTLFTMPRFFLLLSNKSYVSRFFNGHGILIGTITMSFVLSTLMTVYLCRENARRDREAAALGKMTMDDYTQEQKDEQRHRGDYATFFRYTV